MASTTPAHAEEFAKIDSQIRSGQKKKALRTVEEVLKTDSKDKDAIKAKIFLLIDLGRCQDALALIQKFTSLDDFRFQEAYCLYKTGELSKSLEVLDGAVSKDDIASLHLKAQLQHRLGLFKEAIETYRLLAVQHKESGPDLKTNLLAACLQGNKSKDMQSILGSMDIRPSDGFEVAYNLACIQLEENQINSAKETFQMALRLGQESLLDEDLTEEQAGEELMPVHLQIAYADAISNNHEQALQTYEELSQSTSGDEGSQAVALNNKIAGKILTTHPEALRSTAQESLKEIDSLFEKGASGLQLKTTLEKRISLAQQQVLYTNRVLLLLLAGKVQNAKDTTQRLQRRFKDAPGVQLLRVSIAALGSKFKDAQQILESGVENSVNAKLLRAQLASQARDFEQASSILSELGDESEEAAVVTSRCAMLEASGKESEALDLLLEARKKKVSSRTKKKSAGSDAAILAIVSRLQLKAGAVKDAFKTFKELQSLDRNTAGSAAVIGQLAAAGVENDPQAAASLGDHLQPLPTIPAQTINELESTGAGRMAKAEVNKRAATSEAANEPAKRKRKTQKRMPKNFDPENPGPLPDPERWLPKWQRAEFRRKRRNRNTKDTKKGHQGGAVDESLDRTNTETPAPQPNLPKRAQRGRGKAGKR